MAARPWDLCEQLEVTRVLRFVRTSANPKLNSRYTKHWQEDRAVAAGSPCASRGCRGRKVRTPQGSVPDNVRDAGFKARGRLVPQKTYRQQSPRFGTDDWPEGRTPGRPVLVRVKRCGKSAPLRQ